MALAIVVIAVGRTSGTAQDPKLPRPAQEFHNSIIARIQKTCAHPRGAMLAHLALEVLKPLELLDLHSWPKDERKLLPQDIEWLISVDPGPTNSWQKNVSNAAAKQSVPVKTKRSDSGSASRVASATRRETKNSSRPINGKTRA